MSFWDIFTSRHTKWLEAEIKAERESHAQVVEALKSAHKEEMDRVIQENQRLKDDCERFRILLTPRLAPEDMTPPPAPDPNVITGTPWERVKAREIARLNAEATSHFTKAPDAAPPTSGTEKEGVH